MATYWVDPYLETGLGGLPSSTGSGSGTWASPYSLTDLENSTNYNAFNDGDFLYFKGVLESDLFKPAAETSNASTTSTRFYVNSGDEGKTFKYTNKWGGTSYFTTMTTTTYCQKFGGSSTWEGHMIPPTNDNYIPLTNNYQFNNGSIKDYHLLGNFFTTQITIRAGFLTELEGTNNTPTGITVLSCNSNVTISLGATSSSVESTTMVGKGPTIDCKNTLIYTSCRRAAHWCVKDFKMLSFVSGPYSVTDSAAIGIYGNTVDCVEFGGNGGYCYLWFFGSGTINVTFVNYMGGFTPAFYLRNNISSPQNYVFSFTRYLGYNDLEFTWASVTFQSNSIEFVYPSNYHYLAWNDRYPFSFSNTLYNEPEYITETFNGNPDYDFDYLPSQPTNFGPNSFLNKTGEDAVEHEKSIIDATETLPIPSAGRIKPINITFQNIYFSVYKLMVTDVALEDLVYCDVNSFYKTEDKIHVLSNSFDMRPFYIKFPDNNYWGSCCYEYISKDTNWNGERVWHFSPHSAKLQFSEEVYNVLPDYSSNNIDYDATYKVTEGADITLNVKIYGVSEASGYVLQRDLTPTIDTAPTGYDQFVINETLTSAELTADTVSTLYTVITVTPNSGTAVNVITIPDATVVQV